MSERCEQTSEWTSEWPSTAVWILEYSGPQCFSLSLLLLKLLPGPSWRATCQSGGKIEEKNRVHHECSLDGTSHRERDSRTF